MNLLPKHQAMLLGAVLVLALLLVLLVVVLIRWVRRQRIRDARTYSPETDDPALLHAQIDRLQPCLMQVALDGVDELRRGWRESERAELRAGAEAILEEWAATHEGLLAKLEDNRYQMLVQQPMLNRMVETKFAVLDAVRAYQFRGKRAGVTISIGVGHGTTYAECGSNSRQALDLALGRGGDQAVVKNWDLSYDFYGGVSKRVEKTEKVRVRIMATAFADLIHSCDQVYVMGHINADFDSLGAAAGVCAMAHAQSKPAYVVLEPQGTMAVPLLKLWEEQDTAPEVIAHKRALQGLSSKTLVVLVDAHTAQMAECPQLLEKAKLTAVIDHHRQSADYLTGTSVFYLEPGVSSCCEMVTELLQYTQPAPRISPAQADALLSGIMLDTRSFVLRTGAATFEAAAWLRARAGDPVRVKRLFAGDQQMIRHKLDIVIRAQLIGRCAISIARTACDGAQRMVCSQAADELLNIQDVDAAFILFAEEGKICISARSLGARNVQVVMEKLGGGGHQTMAAAQLPQESYTMESAVRLLMDTLSE